MSVEGIWAGGILKVWGPMPKKEYANGLESLIEAGGDVSSVPCAIGLDFIDLLVAEIWANAVSSLTLWVEF